MKRSTDVRQFVRNRLVFYGQVLKQTSEVGAFTLTTRVVAQAVADPIVRNGHPLRVLEVGAGTGALTRAVIDRLGAGDRLDLYEINPEFVRVLREEFKAVPGGPEIHIYDVDCELIPEDAKYDYVVSSLPIMNFPAEKVRRIFARLERALLPEGTISYYDYWAKEVRCFITPNKKERRRMREVLQETREFRKRMDYRGRLVAWNFPPALVHRLRRPQSKG